MRYYTKYHIKHHNDFKAPHWDWGKRGIVARTSWEVWNPWRAVESHCKIKVAFSAFSFSCYPATTINMSIVTYPMSWMQFIVPGDRRAARSKHVLIRRKHALHSSNSPARNRKIIIYIYKRNRIVCKCQHTQLRRWGWLVCGERCQESKQRLLG